MAYADQHARSRVKPIAAVVIVHVAIGYAFISGLAFEAIRHVPAVFRVVNISEAPPPPPNRLPPPETERAQPQERLTAPTTTVDRPADFTLLPVPLPPVTPATTARVEPPPAPPPATPSMSRTASAKGDRRGWITTDDYPARSLREGEEGSVAISARIGTDGRVEGCTVTASSGFPMLDEATCRLYARRARFMPALDAAGTPVATTTTDRIRWTIPR